MAMEYRPIKVHGGDFETRQAVVTLLLTFLDGEARRNPGQLWLDTLYQVEQASEHSVVILNDRRLMEEWRRARDEKAEDHEIFIAHFQHGEAGTRRKRLLGSADPLTFRLLRGIADINEAARRP